MTGLEWKEIRLSKEEFLVAVLVYYFYSLISEFYLVLLLLFLMFSQYIFLMELFLHNHSTLLVSNKQIERRKYSYFLGPLAQLCIWLISWRDLSRSLKNSEINELSEYNLILFIYLYAPLLSAFTNKRGHFHYFFTLDLHIGAMATTSLQQTTLNIRSFIGMPSASSDNLPSSPSIPCTVNTTLSQSTRSFIQPP